MSVLDYHVFLLLSLVCVPISWSVPRAHAFDAVAGWTALCLVVLSPATALWLTAIVLGLPKLLAGRDARRGPRAVLAILLLTVGLIVSRALPGWAWIGGAFFTLRAMHVVIEWWMRRLSAPSLRESLHYFLFLPVLAAGPIHRLPHFQHQLRRRRWDPQMFFTGAERILLGLVWFYVVASFVLVQVDARLAWYLSDVADFWSVWARAAVSWLELFFAFSGTTHLALGISLMMGLKLEENFDRPWAARNLVDFWTRWHMTLTHWVRDYAFRPLTALTRSPVVGLLGAMLVVGLWHEFSLYYVLWAMWQSLGILLSQLVNRRIGARWRRSWITAPFGFLAILAWLSAARPVIELMGVGH